MANLDDEDDVPIKVGDRVNLNTDEGPDMMVSKLETEDGVEQATCVWFEDQRQGGNEGPIWVLKEETLPVSALNILEEQ
jgi:uncharacterized protein YodC (DUF2158 family)